VGLIWTRLRCPRLLLGLNRAVDAHIMQAHIQCTLGTAWVRGQAKQRNVFGAEIDALHQAEPFTPFFGDRQRGL
jgi:hypothetical protein